MPNLFISYRRDDAPAYARLVYGRLREWFGEASCFMDVEQIALGDDWKRVLDERVSRCDVLIAVIGPGWLTAAGGEGRRRLDDPEDFVRWEIREAFVRGKRVIPVLMEGAALLRADDLPPDLARLASLEAQTVTHARFDKDVESLIDAVDPDGRIPDLARRFSRLTRMGKASVAVAALVAAATIALAWANAFDLLGLDTRTASLTMLLGDMLFEVPLSSELVLVGIRPRPEDTNGLDPSHRREYAQLVDIASQGGARTVAFDLRLESASAFDAELVRSVRAAGERRTAVIFGFQELVGGDPVTPPDLARVARVGLTCVGAKLERAVLGTVALRRGDRVYGSLPLEAAFTPVVIDRPPPEADVLPIRLASGAGQWIRFSLRERIEQADLDCPARAPGTEVARLLMRLSHRERLRESSRRFDMNAVLDGTVDRRVFSGKRVLVGAEHPLDAFQTRMDINGRRYGFEFHADVLNALLNDAAIRPMPFSAQWLMVLLMIVVAAAYRLWRLDLSHRWDGLVLVAGCALYLAVAVIVYAKFQLLADGLYHIAAFVGTWWLLAVLERRWFRGKRTAA
jgi:CHASE2 domain-containing sensor protein